MFLTGVRNISGAAGRGYETFLYINLGGTKHLKKRLKTGGTRHFRKSCISLGGTKHFHHNVVLIWILNIPYWENNPLCVCFRWFSMACWVQKVLRGILPTQETFWVWNWTMFSIGSFSIVPVGSSPLHFRCIKRKGRHFLAKFWLSLYFLWRGWRPALCSGVAHLWKGLLESGICSQF